MYTACLSFATSLMQLSIYCYSLFLFVYTAHVSVCLFYLYFLLKIQREPSSKHGLGLIQASYFHAVITAGDLCHLLKMLEQLDMLQALM